MFRNSQAPLVLLLLVVVGLGLAGCGGGGMTINAPDDIAALLNEGIGDEYAYYASADNAPESWDDIAGGALWICQDEDYPPLLPDNVRGMLTGGGFMAGTLINLDYDGKEALGINEVFVTVGVTVGGCAGGAMEAMAEESGTIVLTEINSEFEGKEDLVRVDFE